MNVFLINQTEVSLIDQRRGLERVGRTLMGEAAMCEPAQFPVHQGHQLLQGTLVPIAPGDEQLTYLLGGRCLHFLDSFGQLQIYLVDAADVFLSKLSSIRSKDLDDLRITAPQLDKDILVRRLTQNCSSMLAAPDLRQRAEQNWYILYGEALPTGE